MAFCVYLTRMCYVVCLLDWFKHFLRKTGFLLFVLIFFCAIMLAILFLCLCFPSLFWILGCLVDCILGCFMFCSLRWVDDVCVRLLLVHCCFDKVFLLFFDWSCCNFFLSLLACTCLCIFLHTKKAQRICTNWKQTLYNCTQSAFQEFVLISILIGFSFGER